MKSWLSSPVKGLLIDISGVLKDGHHAIPGSVEAFNQLLASGIPFRIVTNETQCTIDNLVKNLHQLGFAVNESDLFAPIPAVKKILDKETLRPLLLVYPEVADEFKEVNTTDPNCVIVGDACHEFNYENLNKAFRLLISMKDPVLISLGVGRYYREGDGLLTMDVGAFTKAIEYAVGVDARIVGKPDPGFFLSAVNDLGIKPEEAVMIGDDLASDVGGAQGCGIRGVLVRTGKYRPEDENHPTVKPDAIVDNFSEAIRSILKEL